MSDSNTPDIPEEGFDQMLSQHLSRRVLLRRLGLVAVAGAAMPSVLAACGGDDDDSDAETSSSPETSGSSATSPATTVSGGTTKDTLVVALAATPPGIDWDAYFQDESSLGYNNLYNTALRWKKVPVEGNPDMMTSDFSTLEPQLAESWEFSNEGQTITIKLKEGIISHAGNELTADDFIYTRERSLALAAVGTFLLNAQGIKRLENIVRIDDYTVQVSSDVGPNPLLASGNTNIFYNVFDSIEMKAHATDEDPWSQEWVRTHSAGFGPYKLVSLEAGKGMEWEAHEQYWDGAPPIKRIIFQEVPESSNRLSLLTSGSVDVADKLTPRELNSLASGSAATVYSCPSTSMGIARLNMDSQKLADKRVRQALNYSFPVDEVLTSVYYGLATPLRSAMPSIVPGYEDVSPYSYDLDKAQSLLDEAGASELELTVIYQIGQDEMEQVALIWQQSLEQIGVTLTLSKQSDSAFNDLMSVAGDYEIALSKDGGPIQPDVNYALGLSFYSVTDTRTCCNYVGFVEPEVDDGLAEGAAIVDQQERIDYHKPLIDKILDEAPWVFWSNAGYQIAAASNVRGVTYESPQSILYKDLNFV